MYSPHPHGVILIVDDDTNIVDLLKFNLGSEGYGTETVPKAADVDISRVADMRLVIADAMNQPFSGLDLIRSIKESPLTQHVPIIICSGSESEDCVIEAFDCGADDYIFKPFSLRELLARMRSVLRRYPRKFAELPVAVRQDLKFDDLGLCIDVEKQHVTVGDTTIPLTKTEYQILLFLVKNRNSYFNRNEICREIWNNDSMVNSRIVDTNISRLRKKMGDAGRSIINRYGLGYAFIETADKNI